MSLAPPYRRCENGAKCFVTCPGCEDLDRSFSSRLPPAPPPIMTGSDIEDLIARLDTLARAPYTLGIDNFIIEAVQASAAAVKALSSLRAENEELALDRVRLTWLAESGARVCHASDGDCCWIRMPATREDDDYNLPGTYNTWREAIDAARSVLASREGKR